MDIKLNFCFSFLILQNNVTSDSGVQVNINWFNMLGQFFFLIVLFAIILVGAYYVTKWIGKFQNQRYQGNNIKVIESVAIAPQKMLQLIQVGKKLYLIGVSKDNIVFLSEIEKETIKNLNTNLQDSSVIRFDSYLKQLINKLNKDSQSNDISSSGEIHDEEK